jgi:hypothetical protein
MTTGVREGGPIAFIYCPLLDNSKTYMPMKKILIIKSIVVTIVLISTVVLNTNCKTRVHKEESNSTEVKTDKTLNSKTEKDPASKKEREFYPKIACGCHTTILLKEDGTVCGHGEEMISDNWETAQIRSGLPLCRYVTLKVLVS